MSNADRSSFVYTIYIRTTPDALWEALTHSQFTRKFWFDMAVQCECVKGALWKLVRPDGTITDAGEVLEIDAPHRMVIRWAHEWKPELKVEGPGRCTFELEPVERAVKLTVTHEMDLPQSKLIAMVRQGWPRIISNLKSLLETGEVILTEN